MPQNSKPEVEPQFRKLRRHITAITCDYLGIGKFWEIIKSEWPVVKKTWATLVLIGLVTLLGGLFIGYKLAGRTAPKRAMSLNPESQKDLELVRKSLELAEFPPDRHGVMFIVNAKVHNEGPDTTIDNWILVIKDRNDVVQNFYLRDPKRPFIAAGRWFSETDSLAEKTELKRLIHGDSVEGFLAFEAYDFNPVFFQYEGTKIELLFNGGKTPYHCVLKNEPIGSGVIPVTPVTNM